MKYLKQFLVMFSILIFGLSLISYKTSLKKKPETKIIYGASITTESLHNAVIGEYDPNVYRQFANAWFKKYTLTVSAPSGWHFTGKPFVNCVKDNQGACGWNNFAGSPDRFYTTQNGPSSVETTCWAGSRSIEINLACEATKD